MATIKDSLQVRDRRRMMDAIVARNLDRYRGPVGGMTFWELVDRDYARFLRQQAPERPELDAEG
jgi:hypothetical protein